MRWSPESGYDHRLHGILLVARGMSGGQVGRVLGDVSRIVAYWVGRFEEEGLASMFGVGGVVLLPSDALAELTVDSFRDSLGRGRGLS